MFMQTQLSGGRVLVRGTDVLGNQGQQVLHSSEWSYLQSHAKAHEAQDDFDRATKEFFAPLTAAAEQLQEALTPKQDDLFCYTLHDAVEGREGREAEVVLLSQDSAILRLLSTSAQPDRLIWVNDQLEITAEAVTSTPSFVPVTEDNEPF